MSESISDQFSSEDARWMRRALELSQQGEGAVEPNPMVGCVLVRDDQCIGEGWHRRCGGPHAEVEALATVHGGNARGATAYVTLEPCSHHGRTPPCANALIEAQVTRVVVAVEDPFPQVAGRGLKMLQDAGIVVQAGLLEQECRQILAPYLTRVTQGRPWLIAKWAMTLDGKIACSSGDSQWISGNASRAKVHQLRSRVDGILTGIGTVLADNPLLTARLEGSHPLRHAVRIVCDRRLRIPLDCQLVKTASEHPTLIATCNETAPDEGKIAALQAAGCEVLMLPRQDYLPRLLKSLADRDMTNVMIEAGAELHGALFDGQYIDEFWAFVAPKLVGGSGPSPLSGHGVPTMGEAVSLDKIRMEQVGDDVWIHGRTRKDSA